MGELSGPFTTAQARAAGYSENEIRARLRSGSWTRLRHGVYLAAAGLDGVDDDPARLHALEVSSILLTLGFPAIAAATSAARIWGIELVHGGSEPVVVTGDRAVTGVRRNGYLLRRARLPNGHQASRHGVPLTSVARTVFDLSRELPFVEAVVAVDSALRKKLVSVEQLDELVRDCWNWAGIARARQVFEFADPAAESVLESVSRAALHEQGLPRPRTQVTVRDESGRRHRVDFLWDDFRVIGEADGLGKYEPADGRTTRDIVRAEKRREEWLGDAGCEVVRWGWEDARDPRRLALRVRAALARGAQRAYGRGHRAAS